MFCEDFREILPMNLILLCERAIKIACDDQRACIRHSPKQRFALTVV